MLSIDHRIGRTVKMLGFSVLALLVGVVIPLMLRDWIMEKKERPNKVQLDLIETIREDTLLYKVELAEHRYIIKVWGDDYEFTDSSHDSKCRCDTKLK